jgi:hypothetical protein
MRTLTFSEARHVAGGSGNLGDLAVMIGVGLLTNLIYDVAKHGLSVLADVKVNGRSLTNDEITRISAAAQDGKRNSDGSFDDGLSIHFHDTGDYWWEHRRSTVREYGQLVAQNP